MTERQKELIALKQKILDDPDLKNLDEGCESLVLSLQELGNAPSEKSIEYLIDLGIKELIEESLEKKKLKFFKLLLKWYNPPARRVLTWEEYGEMTWEFGDHPPRLLNAFDSLFKEAHQDPSKARIVCDLGVAFIGENTKITHFFKSFILHFDPDSIRRDYSSLGYFNSCVFILNELLILACIHDYVDVLHSLMGKLKWVAYYERLYRPYKQMTDVFVLLDAVIECCLNGSINCFKILLGISVFPHRYINPMMRDRMPYRVCMTVQKKGTNEIKSLLEKMGAGVLPDEKNLGVLSSVEGEKTIEFRSRFGIPFDVKVHRNTKHYYYDYKQDEESTTTIKCGKCKCKRLTMLERITGSKTTIADYINPRVDGVCQKTKNTVRIKPNF